MRISYWSSDVCSSDLPCAVELLFVRGTGVIEDLELGKHGLRSVDPDPSYVYLHPDGSSIAIFRDPKRTAEDMARLNRNDGKAYLKFLQVLDAMADIGFPLMMAEPGRPGAGDLAKMIGGAIRNVKLKDELTALTKATADQVACEWRSEEHTSELQSLMRISYAVFCLKKKITINTSDYKTT